MSLAGKKVVSVLALGISFMGAAIGAHTMAQAATPSLLVTGATTPRGGLVLQGTALDPATGKPVTHYWTPDIINGLCRVDVDPATGAGTMNLNTCVHLLGGGQIKPGQLSYDPINQFIYVPDLSSGSQGVWRLGYLPSGDNGNGAISLVDRTLLAPNCGLGGNLPWATALGPDGNLYVGYKKTGNIVRINHPASSPAPTCADVQVIGNSADGRLSFALAFMGSDLWEADGRGLGVLPNAPACSPASPCAGINEFTGNPALPNALAPDPVNQVLYVGDPSNIYALNLGSAPGTATISVYATGFQFVFGLAVDPSTLAVGQAPLIYAGDDPSRGLIPGAGRIFKVTALAPATPPPAPAAPAPIAQAATPSLLVTGATTPRGGLVLQGTALDPATGKPVTHYWTPDTLDGLCRVDVNPVTGAGTMNQNTCVLFLGGNQIKPGQLSYDPTNQFIYVPDLSSHSQGVWRLRYLPSADNGNGAISLVDRTLLAPNCGLGTNLPWASALGPDGNLYLGFKKTGNIVRINHPAGFTQCGDVQVIGSSADGKLSFALAFMGSDLWEADGRGLGVIVNAPACATATTGTCNAVGVFTGNPALPNALASDPVNHVLYVGDPSNVYALNLAAGNGTATISTYATGFSFVFGLAVDPTTLAVGQAPLIYAGDDPSRGLIPGAGRIFKVQ